MKVIVAGFPKTGTKTMTEALTKLGYKTYDVFEHYWFHGEEWIKILNHGGSTEDFYEMYKDVDAVVDTPASHFWEEIHKAFPEAKIILTTRDDEDRWFDSFKKQMADCSLLNLEKFYYMFASNGINPLKIIRYHLQYVAAFFRVVFKAWPPNYPPNELITRMLFRQHNAYVMQKAPKDKLLVYKAPDGWEPLCRFLGKDVPDCPFPHKNKNSALVAEILADNPIAAANLKVAKRKCCVILFVILPVFLAVVIAMFIELS